jgi:hypothetical protein
MAEGIGPVELLEWARRLGFELERRGSGVWVNQIRPAPSDMYEQRAWKAERKEWKNRYNEIFQDVMRLLPDLGEAQEVRSSLLVAARIAQYSEAPRQIGIFEGEAAHG